MDDQSAWEQRGQAAREGIAALGFMVGSWTGTGSSRGQAITGKLEVCPILDGTWLEARETQFDAAGVQEHADVSLYRYDPEEHRLEVIHLMDHAYKSRHPVEPVEGAFHWVTGPMAPRLEIRPSPTGLRFEVWFPQDEQATVIMDYTAS